MSGGGTPAMVTQTSTTEPWDQQKKYLTGGFKGAADIYNKGFPEYYPGETLAGFDPSEQMYQSAVQGYVTGDRAIAQQAGAEDRLLKGLSGEIDYSTFNPMMDYLGRQATSQLQGQVLPGLRRAQHPAAPWRGVPQLRGPLRRRPQRGGGRLPGRPRRMTEGPVCPARAARGIHRS